MSQDNHNPEPVVKERIAKRIARAGICSRRDAERLIEQGKVRVNGQVLASPAFTVSQSDEIVVNGQKLSQAEAPRMFLYHKPIGLVTTHKDERGRETVFDSLPKNLPRLISVGRLDLNTEGLLLLTNDGALARYLELPSTGWTRKYRVRVLGSVSQEKLDRLKGGVTIEGVRYKPIRAVLEGGKDKANQWIGVSLQEGKNREIRRVMEYLGLQVNRLIRVSYGPFDLGKLPKGSVQEVPEKTLRAQLEKFFKDQS